MTTFKTRLVAIITAGALALGVAGPAAAASDGQKAFTTVLGLLALGAIINNIDDDRGHVRRVAPPPPRHDVHRDNRRDDRRGHRDVRRDDRDHGRHGRHERPRHR